MDIQELIKMKKESGLTNNEIAELSDAWLNHTPLPKFPA